MPKPLSQSLPFFFIPGHLPKNPGVIRLYKEKASSDQGTIVGQLAAELEG